MSSTKEIKNQILKSLVSMLNNSNDLIVKRDVSKQIKALLTNLIEDIQTIIKWYSRLRTKQAIKDFLEDYIIIDKRFLNAIQELPADKFYCNICPKEGNLTISQI